MNRDEAILTLLTKGVQQIIPSTEEVKTLLLKPRQLKVYAGFDPTAPTLHIGHAIQLRKLRHFQDLGHQVIFLIGDFTARIGDPTDKLAARITLSEKEIKRNLRQYKKQASKFIRFSGKNSAKIMFNSKWLSKLRFEDILEIASHMTVDQLQKRDMFVKRHEEGKPVFLHEFLYPLMQGYDSVAMAVDGEIGGNDQLFNMLAGRTLLQQIKNRDKFVITLKLLEDGSGKKMGKSEGNMISLNDSPEDIYGKVMSWPDSMIGIGYELCTDLSSKEIEETLKRWDHPKDQKMGLAYQIVKTIYPEEYARKAALNFVNTFVKGNIPENVLEIPELKTFKETILKSGTVESASELRRLVTSGAISSVSTGEKLGLDDMEKKPKKDIYRIGKSRFVKII